MNPKSVDSLNVTHSHWKFPSMAAPPSPGKAPTQQKLPWEVLVTQWVSKRMTSSKHHWGSWYQKVNKWNKRSYQSSLPGAHWFFKGKWLIKSESYFKKNIRTKPWILHSIYMSYNCCCDLFGTGLFISALKMFLIKIYLYRRYIKPRHLSV